MSSGPLYEKTAVVASDLEEAFGDWLREHLLDAAAHAGVLAVDAASSPGDGDDAPKRHTWRYTFDNDESLDVFLEREGNDSYPGAEQRFGDELSTSSRVLREDSVYSGDESPPACLNCGAVLRGQYCGNCGQRARTRLISLWELVRDAFGDLFELDSRIWQTLIPLLVRPGRLTYDYLAGRRARYMPPFRMYLVMSLVFFVVAFFNPREELALLYAPETEAPVSEEASPGEAGTDGESAEGESTENKLSENTLSESDPDAAIPEEARAELERFGLDVDAINQRIAEAEENDADGMNISFGDEDGDSEAEDCNLDWDVSNMPQWVQVRFSEERVVAVCERIRADDGDSFGKRVLDNVPLALFILLPLMALVLVFLYPLSKRYYVEHLLFFVHFHAFFFLILTLQVLWTRLIGSLNGPGWLAVLPVVATSLYIPVYLFKAMRRVYEQGWALTMLKYLLLIVAYAAGFGTMLLLALLIAVAGS